MTPNSTIIRETIIVRIRQLICWTIALTTGYAICDTYPVVSEIVHGEVAHSIEEPTLPFARSFSDASRYMLIQQASDQAIVNYDSFNIGDNHQVRIVQPSVDSAFLGRVIGNEPSGILGHLESNGRVYLVNENGIAFGPDATVNVKELTASTLDVDDVSFISGSPIFSGSGGLVQNLGTLTADVVNLIGAQIQNHGSVSAQQIGLYAGKNIVRQQLGGGSITLDFTESSVPTFGINSTGVISAHAEGPNNPASISIESEGDIVVNYVYGNNIDLAFSGQDSFIGNISLSGDSNALFHGNNIILQDLSFSDHTSLSAHAKNNIVIGSHDHHSSDSATINANSITLNGSTISLLSNNLRSDSLNITGGNLFSLATLNVGELNFSQTEDIAIIGNVFTSTTMNMKAQSITVQGAIETTGNIKIRANQLATLEPIRATSEIQLDVKNQIFLEPIIGNEISISHPGNGGWSLGFVSYHPTWSPAVLDTTRPYLVPNFLTAGPTELPVLSSVESGSVTVSPDPADHSLEIHQTTELAIVNYDSFSIGKDGQVVIDMPDESSTHIAKISNEKETIWDGMLQSNGSLYILTPGGAIIGESASIDVSNLTISTLPTMDWINFSNTNQSTGSISIKNDSISADSLTIVSPEISLYQLTGAGSLIVASGDSVNLGTNISATGNGSIYFSQIETGTDTKIVSAGSILTGEKAFISAGQHVSISGYDLDLNIIPDVTNIEIDAVNYAYLYFDNNTSIDGVNHSRRIRNKLSLKGGGDLAIFGNLYAPNIELLSGGEIDAQGTFNAGEKLIFNSGGDLNIGSGDLNAPELLLQANGSVNVNAHLPEKLSVIAGEDINLTADPRIIPMRTMDLSVTAGNDARIKITDRNLSLLSANVEGDLILSAENITAGHDVYAGNSILIEPEERITLTSAPQSPEVLIEADAVAVQSTDLSFLGYANIHIKTGGQFVVDVPISAPAGLSIATPGAIVLNKNIHSDSTVNIKGAHGIIGNSDVFADSMTLSTYNSAYISWNRLAEITDQLSVYSGNILIAPESRIEAKSMDLSAHISIAQAGALDADSIRMSAPRIWTKGSIAAHDLILTAPHSVAQLGKINLKNLVVTTENNAVILGAGLADYASIQADKLAIGSELDFKNLSAESNFAISKVGDEWPVQLDLVTDLGNRFGSYAQVVSTMVNIHQTPNRYTQSMRLSKSALPISTNGASFINQTFNFDLEL